MYIQFSLFLVLFPYPSHIDDSVQTVEDSVQTVNDSALMIDKSIRMESLLTRKIANLVASLVAASLLLVVMMKNLSMNL